jgi:hypothetical protein
MPPEQPMIAVAFKIGFDSADPESMLIQIPIREWALDMRDGTALFHGHMKGAEAVGMRQMMEIRKRRQGMGLTVPNGHEPNLSVP